MSSIVAKFSQIIFAALRPMLRIPRAKTSLKSSFPFDFSIEEIRFCADFSALRSRLEISSALSL